MHLPKASVIIPVYNGEQFVQDSINSILNQTFTDFELIIINDGSHDSSVDIIKSYNDPRIVFINNEVNTGLPKVRNQGVYASRGEYIAWLDCDDTSVPERLEKQLHFLEQNPKVGVCGAWVNIVGEEKNIIAQFPADSEYIRASLLFNNCFANSTVMMRASCTRQIGLRFDLSHHLSQDYGLWVRIPQFWELTNMPEILTNYRLHRTQVTEIYKQKQIDISWEIQKEQLLELGIHATEQIRIIHMSLSGFIPNTFESTSKLVEAKNYLIELDKANQIYKRYNKKKFREVLLSKWLICINLNSPSVKSLIYSCWIMFKFGSLNLVALWLITKRNIKNSLSRLISVFIK